MEVEDWFLEGIGSFIFDCFNCIVYVCLSLCMEGELLDIFCIKMGYKKVVFIVVDGDGEVIYYINVMMVLGVDFVVICLDVVFDKVEQ